jgi:hypothetical protein
MNLNYKELIPLDFNDTSRVWIYQANRSFSLEETALVKAKLAQFVQEWRSHGERVKGFAQLFFDQFIVIMADESATGVSGCSTDSSVRVMKEIEQEFNVPLFNRQSLAFLINNEVKLVALTSLNEAVNANLLDGNTLYFNNTLLSKHELMENWIILVKDSWLGKRIKAKELSS